MNKRERRRYKRFFIDGLGIHCRITSGSEASLLEIGPIGANIMINERLMLGSEHMLEIEREGLQVSIKSIVESIEDAAEENEYGPVCLVKLKFPTLNAAGDDISNFLTANFSRQTLKNLTRDLNVRVVGANTKRISGTYKITEMSFGGMRIEADQYIEPKSILKMNIVFSMNRPPAKITGRVAACWMILDKTPPLFNTGIEFMDIKEKDMNKLKDFIYLVQELGVEI